MADILDKDFKHYFKDTQEVKEDVKKAKKTKYKCQ